jgi:hypothetical protein
LSRLRLLEKAEKSGDLQYFLMKGDTAGDVMLHAMLKAADRGVRVRFLLDKSNLVEFPRFEEVAAPPRSVGALGLRVRVSGAHGELQTIAGVRGLLFVVRR